MDMNTDIEMDKDFVKSKYRYRCSVPNIEKSKVFGGREFTTNHIYFGCIKSVNVTEKN